MPATATAHTGLVQGLAVAHAVGGMRELPWLVGPPPGMPALP